MLSEICGFLITNERNFKDLCLHKRISFYGHKALNVYKKL